MGMRTRRIAPENSAQRSPCNRGLSRHVGYAQLWRGIQKPVKAARIAVTAVLRREAPRRVRAPEAKFTRACSRETSAAAFPRRTLATLAGHRMLVFMCIGSHAWTMSNFSKIFVGLLHGHTVAGTCGRRVGVEVFAIRVSAGLRGGLRGHCPRSHKSFQKRRQHAWRRCHWEPHSENKKTTVQNFTLCSGSGPISFMGPFEIVGTGARNTK